MITFFDLAPTMRTVFSSLFFLSMCGGIYLVSTTFRRRHSFSRSLIPIIAFVNGMISFPAKILLGMNIVILFNV